MRPRLLVITSTFPRWADDCEPPFVYELARRLTDRFDVDVLAPHARGARRRERLEGMEIHRFRYAPNRLEQLAYSGGIPSKLRRRPWLIVLVPIFVAAQLLATIHLVRKIRPAVVHAHWLIPGGLIASLARDVSHEPFRLVVTAHGADLWGFRGPLLTAVKRWIVRQADQVTVVSAALAREAQALGVAPDRLTVQGMGTDLSETFVPAEPHNGPPTLVYAGRLVEKKGVDTLLQATAILRRTIQGLCVRIAGHGPQLDELVTLCQSLQVDDIVEFAGPYTLAALPNIFRQADVAVFPFRAAEDGDQDGLGLAIIEAMGCGLPVVGSDIEVLDDLLVQEVTALRAPADDPAAFARAIEQALMDRPASQRRAALARRWVSERYDWSSVAECYANLLQVDVNPADAPTHPGYN